LENRLAPAVYFWQPEIQGGVPVAPLNWNVLNNWKVNDPVSGNPIRVSDLQDGNPLKRVPAAGDPVTFNSSGNFDCFVNNAVTVYSLVVSPGYSKKITLQQPLTISNHGLSSNSPPNFHLVSSSASIGGTAQTTGTLNLYGGSQSGWSVGQLENLIVNVGGEGEPATLSVGSPVNGPTMHGTAINVNSGMLKWNLGNVDVTNADEISSINVGANGVFEINVEYGV
jgi:hypothetical protein